MKNFTDIQTALWVDGPAAVNTKTGVLYINENEFYKLGENSRRFVIMHELGHLNSDKTGEYAADEYAFEKMVGLGDSSIKIIKAFYDAMPFTDSEQKQRAEVLLKKVFENEFRNGNTKAKAVVDIFDSIMPGEENLHNFFKNGSLLKISGKIGQAIGGVLTAIPVTSAIGAAVTAAGSAQVAAGNNIAAKIADGEAAAGEIEAYLSQLEAEAKLEDLQREVDMATEKTEKLDEEKKKNTGVFIVVAIVVIGLIFLFLKD